LVWNVGRATVWYAAVRIWIATERRVALCDQGGWVV